MIRGRSLLYVAPWTPARAQHGMEVGNLVIGKTQDSKYMVLWLEARTTVLVAQASGRNSNGETLHTKEPRYMSFFF
jgi:hypothetical protein